MSPMNNRLLRPGSNEFTPKSISGLALWLDAADSSTVFQSDTAAATSVTAPTDIPGCIGWWDASDAMTITADPVTQKVSQWAGKVGGRHFTQSNTANQPVLEAATLNGGNVIRLSSATQMTVANDKTTWNPLHQAGATGGWVFAVFQPFNTPSTEQWGRFLGTDGFTSANSGWNVFLDDRATLGLNGSLRFGISRGAAGTATADSIVNAALSTDTAAYVASLRFDPNNAAAQERLRLFTNGVGGNDIVSNTGAASSANASADLTLGIAGMSTTGFIAELIIFGAMLSYADRARIERYLATKWGVSDVFASASATNNPVGAWLDKSGLGRHATQATGANRPTISATAVQNKKALGFNGTSGRLVLPSMDSTPSTVLAVARHNSGTSSAGRTPLCIMDGANYMSWQFQQTGTVRAGATYNAAQNHFTAGGIDPQGSVLLLTGQMSSGGGGLLGRLNGATLPFTETVAYPDGGQSRIGCRFRNADDQFWSGEVCEVLHYQSALSLSQVQRLERYLAARWGITLAPQVSNADAQDWINRVYANGGTVSATTASAVNTFCNDIDAAGIRDRFYRLNLFCGDNLTACLVPLYRGPSLTGTQFGNAADTNVNFLAADYVESGSAGGLVGNGSSKYLRTGVNPYTAGLVSTDIHLASYIPSLGGASAGGFIVLSAYQLPAELTALSLSPAYGGGNLLFRAGANVNILNAAYSTSTARVGHVLAQRTGASSVAAYHRGVLMSPATTTFAGDVTWTATNNPGNIAVYARSESGAFWYQGALAGYSFGLSMTAAQVLAYNNAAQNFQSALSRAVT